MLINETKTMCNIARAIIETEPNVVCRKILEAYYISLIEPKLNNKDECLDLKRF